MSVLDPETSPIIDPATRIANQLKQNARNIFRNITGSFAQNAKLFWQNPQATPQEIAAALGTDGVELFQLHAKLGELLYSIKPEVTTDTMAIVGDSTYNEDGSVTIPTTSPAE
jgi:hypothetical protein